MLVGITKLFGELDQRDMETMQNARADALYATIDHPPMIKDTIYLIYEWLKKKDEFLDVLYEKIEPIYNLGYRYFELHHKPNVSGGGYTWAWQNGKQFARWFCVISEELRNTFPEIKVGYPSLSYGPDIGGIQVGCDKFLFESREAIDASDFISVLVHWKSRGLDTEIFDAIHYLAYVRYMFDKDVVAVYYNNNNNVQKAVKGQQYLMFLDYTKNIDGVIGAFGHTLSSPSKNDMWITWRSRNSESSIPEIIASREW